MPPKVDVAPRKKKKVKMVPHGPGGQRLRPAVKTKPKKRTVQQKRQGAYVVREAANEKAGPPTPKRLQKAGPPTPRRKLGKTGGGDFKKKPSTGARILNTASIPFLPDAVVRNPKKAAKTTGKILENTGREAIQIPSSIVPSAVHVGKPIYKNPGSPKAYGETAKRVGEAAIALPKEYVKAIDKKGLKGAGELFVDKPLSSALTVAPLPRVPGLAAGGVARRAGKMPRTAPRELPGTAMKVQDKTSKSYFKAKRDAKKPKKEVNDKDIDTRVDEQVALMENLSRTEQAARYKKTYRDRKKVVGKKKAVLEAAEHAGKIEKKVRDEQKFAIAEGMGLVEKPKYKTAKKDDLKSARQKEKAARKELTKIPWVQGQLLRNTGRTIADWTKLEDKETHLFTLMEHHKEEADNARALGNHTLADKHEHLADNASKQLTPIEGELEKLHRVFTNSKGNAGAAQLEADLKHSNYVNARKARKQLESSNVHLVRPAGTKAQIFPEATKAIQAADKYNANPKTSVEMTPFKTKGGYAVVPSSMKKRLDQHEAKSEVGWLGAGLKGYNTVWRKNVLALHPSWYTGNILEAAGRSLVAGVGPTAYVRGFKYQAAHKAADREGAKVAKGHTTSGGHLKMQARLPEETKSDITGHGFLADTARKVQAFRDNPKGPKQTADLFNNFTDFTMGTLSGKAESFFQTGMLGKELARSPLMDGHVNKTSKAAIEDAVKGMKETHNQVALGQAVDRMYGKYGKFSPGRRKMISHYTPFIAWTLNSLEFLGKVLPVDHPVLTAAVASSQTYVDEWLKDEKLSPFVEGALPSFLQGSIPSKKGYARYPTRYLPTSVAAGFPESVVGALLPQLEPAYNMAVHGINWKGQKVNNPDGTPLDPIQLSIAAALTLFEGATPGAQQIASPSDRYAVQGKRGFDIAKPKPTGEIIKSFTNPFVKVKKKEPTKKKNNLDSLIGGSEKPKTKKPKANTLDSLISP